MSNPPKPPSDKQTLLFMVILSFVCATILSLMASALAEPQEVARELYRSKQTLVAARILNPTGGYLQMLNAEGDYVPAKALPGGKLVPGTTSDIPSNEQLLEVYKARFKPYLVDNQGKSRTFEELKIDPKTYLTTNRKTGYYRLPYKLLYEILPNPTDNASSSTTPDGYIIPINGFGLWDAIYGYLAITPDAERVIGISWYDHKETPGLGAVIAEPDWQAQFPNKLIFQEDASGNIDIPSSPIGIVVVRGKVAEVYGDSAKSKNAVDGISGATLTGNGVTAAYRDVLSAYRPFLMHVHEKNQPKSGS